MHEPWHRAPAPAPSAHIHGMPAPCGHPHCSAETLWTAPADLALPVQVPRDLSPKLHWVLYAPPVHVLILFPVEEACARLVLSVLDLHKDLVLQSLGQRRLTEHACMSRLHAKRWGLPAGSLCCCESLLKMADRASLHLQSSVWIIMHDSCMSKLPEIDARDSMTSASMIKAGQPVPGSLCTCEMSSQLLQPVHGCTSTP